LSATAGTAVQGASQASLEQRLTRVERLLESRGLVEMLGELEQLRREVQDLRGQVELQANTLDNLQRRQRELYLDIDRRLHEVEAGAAPAAPAVSGGGESAGGMGVAPPPAPTQMPGAARPSVALPAGDPAKERQAYEHALDVLKEGRYGEAAKAFRAFLDSYPQSRYAANAQYWLGEAYYVTREFETALEEFSKVVNEFPDSSKVADARLKMGFIEYELQRWPQARGTLEAVVADYPDSTAARLARDRLDRMRAEGR
jgi:tol-pal system protein YbgF